MQQLHALLICIILTLSSCSSKFASIIYNLNPVQPRPISRDIEVALVLGGGGSRAISQIGVIEVLEANNIPIDLVVGTSAGSIVGALYSDKQDIERIKSTCLNFRNSDLLKVSIKNALNGARSLRGGFDGSSGEKFVSQNIAARDFKDFKVPLIILATDLISGKSVELRSGDIMPAIRASCAIPGLFSPVELYGMVLVDGCVTAPVGVYAAKKYNPKLIIAVDISAPLEKTKIKNMLDVVHRSAYVSYDALRELNVNQADILIQPKVGNISIFDDSKNNELYQAGRDATLKLLPQIKALMRKKGIKFKAT